jgi:hypothetical protein
VKERVLKLLTFMSRNVDTGARHAVEIDQGNSFSKTVRVFQVPPPPPPSLPLSPTSLLKTVRVFQRAVEGGSSNGLF